MEGVAVTILGGQDCVDCGQRICECSSGSEDAEAELPQGGVPGVTTEPYFDEPEPLNRGLAVAGKQPLLTSWHMEEDEEEPDLAEYFNRFEADTMTRIRLCRTYANYLAASRSRGMKRGRKE